MNCVNCSTTALYEYRITHDKSMFYCGAHLPRFLEPRRRAGSLQITDALNAELTSALAILATNPTAEETPKPVKKAAKKKEE